MDLKPLYVLTHQSMNLKLIFTSHHQGIKTLIYNIKVC